MPLSTPFPMALQKAMITIHERANFKIIQRGWIISWEDACSATMTPWIKSLALNKPGMVVLTCHPTVDVKAEVFGHSWVHCEFDVSLNYGRHVLRKEGKKKMNRQRIYISGLVARETLGIGLQHGGGWLFSVVLTVSFCFVRGSGQHKSFFTVTWVNNCWPQQLINV